MFSKKPTWLDKQSKSGRSGELEDRDDLVYFGYQKVPQEEKVPVSYTHLTLPTILLV